MRSRVFVCTGLAFSMISAVAATAIAQAPAFDYKGDTERVPAEVALDVQAPGYEIVKSDYAFFKRRQSGSVVRMEGFSATTSPGDPLLPVRIYEIAVPPNIDWETLKLSVDLAEPKVLSGKHDLLPAPPARARVDDEELVDWGEGKDIVAGRNMKVYGRDRFFPEEPVRIVSRSQLRKWRFVRVEFSPVQYNPATQTLRLVQSAEIRLRFMRIGKRVFRSDPLLADRAMDQEARRRFVNFEEAQDWYRPAPEPRSGAAPEDPDYVVVTTKAIRDNSTKLADFVAHKTALGHAVRVVTEDDYGTLGDAKAIRQWLIANYVPLGIEYVLLIGDPDPDDPDATGDSVGDVPMIMGWPRRFADSYRESPTDYFFADLTGDWDLDGDGYYGEERDVTAATSPDPAVDPDTFSARWTGRIEADADGSHSFRTISDNGIRIFVDGTPVIDNWTSHSITTNYGSSALTAGQHDIRVEYYDDTGDGVAKVMWRPPGQDYFGIIPSSRLYHLVAGTYVSGGLDAEYFNNTDFTSSAATAVESTVNFVWATGDRGPGGVDFDPEVLVGRIPVYASDYAALDAILQKIIDYETVAPPSWRRALLTANVELWPDQSDYELGEALKRLGESLGHTSYRIYESDFGIVPPPECPAVNAANEGPAAPCNMLGEWANGGGYGLLTWSTHGSRTSAQHLITSVDNAHLDDAAPAFTFQGSCENGHPEASNNLGYSLLQRGAIGTVSASRVSWNSVFNPAWDPNPQSGLNANLTYHYALRLLQDRTAARALYAAKSDVNPAYYWMNKMDFNLYGDPSASLFASVFADGWTDDGEVVRLTTRTDRVGIGTETPSKELEVVSRTVGGGIEISGDASTGTHDSPGAFLSGKDIDGIDRRGGLGLSLSNGHYSRDAAQGDLVLRAKDARIHFATHFPGFPARMTIGSDGHVGIGTTTPTRELQVVSTRAGGGVEVYGDASSGTHDSPGFHLAGKDVGGADREGVLGLSLSSGHYSASAGPGDLVLRSRDGSIHFSTQSSGGYPAKMTLGADGVFFLTPKNLGNTHPTLSGSQLAIGWNHSGGRGETDFYQHGGGGWRSGYDFWTQRDGVGKRLQARIEDTGHLRIRGEYKSLSDVREKTAIQPLSGALEKVLRLRGISFEWADKTSRDEGRRLGLVAQEVREVVPEVVSGGTDEMGGEEPLDLQYDGLIPLLIEAIREQQQAIDRLTRRVGELEAE